MSRFAFRFIQGACLAALLVPLAGVAAQAADLDYSYGPPPAYDRPVAYERPVVVERPVVLERPVVVEERSIYPRPYFRPHPRPFYGYGYGHHRRFAPWHRFAYGPRPYGYGDRY